MSSKSTLNNSASTALFIFIWSSGAILTAWGLQHASALIFLVFRFTIALAVLTVIGIYRRRWLPRSGTRVRIAIIGLLLTGGYSVCYFLALEHGVTPGVMATLLGVQPVLTLLLFERRFSVLRITGLGLALTGLILVVHQSIDAARSSIAGTCFGLGALACITTGAILQKAVTEQPAEVLPLQYSMSLMLCVVILPFEPLTLSFDLGFLIPLLWLGLIISVVAQLLFYRLIRTGNLVNVTSLFYLVPVVTAALDYLLLGNRLGLLSLTGMGAVLVGLWLVFKGKGARRIT
ncbi:MAG: DMT family transporter [Verrucomicrobia bacterium]|nr:DMT family transporter [Verrucomicrobiota bacterium]